MSTPEELLTRITRNPEIFSGKPIVRGKRLAVDHVLASLAAGVTVDELVGGYPFLERDDVFACLACAARAVEREYVAAVVNK